ncbi:hypothetical protein C7212DRAFT_313188, partial [Tuber magnatum]
QLCVLPLHSNTGCYDTHPRPRNSAIPVSGTSSPEVSPLKLLAPNSRYPEPVSLPATSSRR